MSDLPPGVVLDKKPALVGMGGFDTKLSPAEEQSFATWKQQYAPRDSGADYDLRGAFKAGLKPDPQTGHWPDTFKKPNHPTFSNQSMYATGANAAKAGKWQGETFIPPTPAQSGLPPGVVLDKPAWWQSLWSGVVHGAGNVLHGGARIGARMGEAPEIGQTAPSFTPERTQQVDETARQRETTYQASPEKKAHPFVAGMGEVGGEAAGISAEMGPLAAVAGAPGWMGRLLGGAAVGAGASLATPRGGESMAPSAQLQRGLTGAAGGALGGAVAETAGSALSRAIAGNSPQMLDSYITNAYRHAVRPRRGGPESAPLLGMQDRRILTAADQIIENKPNLTLTNPSGQEIKGQLPATLRGFAEALDQTKRSIFARYDAMAAQAGEGGAKVDLAPAIKQLRSLAGKPEVADFHPNLVQQAEQMAQNLERRGTYSATEAQDVIQNLNKTLAAFWKNPTAETVSYSGLLAPVVDTLRSDLDKAVKGIAGPGYGALKKQYGALKSVEKDVAGAAHREAQKLPFGLAGQFADMATAERFIHGIFHLDPGAMATAAGIRAAKGYVKYLNDPNRAIMRLFQHREAGKMPMGLTPTRSPMAGNLGAMSGAGMAGRALPPPREQTKKPAMSYEIAPRPSVVGP